jgi:lipoprotein signal peptidase
VIAPDATDEAKAVFAAKKNLRLLTTGGLPDAARARARVRQVAGGFWCRTGRGSHRGGALRAVTRRHPSRREMADMLFAWTVAKHVKSNAIVYAKDGATVGIGAGQMSRVDSTRIAARKAEDMAEALGLPSPRAGAVVASDAFFPFADGLLAAAEAGATAVIQPGGSMRDEEVIAAADAAGSPWSSPACGISGTEIEVFPPFLVFKLGYNTGINFGLFSGGPEVTRWVLLGLALAISAWLLWWARTGLTRPVALISAGAVIGGALGNALDRLLVGAVVDFLNMSCCGIRNPFAFNVADIGIVMGAIGLLIFADSPKKES